MALIKLEDSSLDSGEEELAEIVPEESEMTTAHGPDTPWKAVDNHFAQLFHPMPQLPVHAGASQTDVLDTLAVLETRIAPFEAYIGHSDEGFCHWRTRHQAAMMSGQARPPSHFPQLVIERDIDRTWDDEA